MAADNALARLCVALVNDAELWARFREEPDAVIAEANLTDEEKDLFANGPVDKLRAYIGRSSARFSAVLITPTEGN